MSHNNYKKLDGMRYPALNDLIKRANNKYELVLATAKRAREIIDGANPLIPVRINNPISIATEEIDEGLIELVNPAFEEHSEKVKTNANLETVQPEVQEDQESASVEQQPESNIEIALKEDTVDSEPEEKSEEEVNEDS